MSCLSQLALSMCLSPLFFQFPLLLTPAPLIQLKILEYRLPPYLIMAYPRAARQASGQSSQYPTSVQLLAGHDSLQDFLDSRLCFLCMSGPREVRAQCGHLLGCKSCTRHLRKCPFCRHRIRSTYDVGKTRVRNSSADSTTTSTSQFSTESAKTCMPRLSYQERALATGQEAGIHCEVCRTQWPDLLQWHEHLSQGLHRRALFHDPPHHEEPFLAYCKECAFYFHDPRSWSLHFGLHQDSHGNDSSSRPAYDADREDIRSLSLLSTTALPDLHSRIQTEQVTCGICDVHLVGLAQVHDHFMTPEHIHHNPNAPARYALHCPFCNYFLNGLDQWEHHLRLPRHRRKKAADSALRQSEALFGTRGEADLPIP